MEGSNTPPLSVEGIVRRIAYYVPKTKTGGHERQIEKWAQALWWREHAPDAPWSYSQIGRALGVTKQRAITLVETAKLYCRPTPEEEEGEEDYPLID